MEPARPGRSRKGAWRDDTRRAGGPADPEAVLRALAGRTLTGELAPRELAFRGHLRFGHELPPAERLAELDDEYDLFHYRTGRTAADLEAEVMAEARRPAGQRGGGTSPVS